MSLLFSQKISLSKRVQGRARYVAFDIDGTSVGVIVTELAANCVPKILFSKREDLPLRDAFDAARNAKDVFERTESLGRELLRELPGEFAKAVFFVTSPYVASQTRVVTSAFEKPTLITDDVLTRLVNAEIDAFKQTELAHFKGENESDNHVMLEAKVMATRLNGYETASPVGKMAREIDLSLYVSIVSEGMSNKLAAIGRALFPGVACELHSRSFALFHTIRHISPEQNYMIIDIRGEVTEMGVVKNGVLIDTISHPTGENSLFRALASSLGMPLATVSSALSLFLSEAGHEEERQRIKQALAHARIEWLGGLGLILKETLEDYLLPAHMYVYANKLTGPFFREFLGDSNLYQYSAANTPFAVTLIDHEFFGEKVVARQDADDVLLSSLALCLDSLYAHRFV